MKTLKTSVLIISSVLIALGCQKKENFNYTEWRTGDSQSVKDELLKIQTESNKDIVKYKNQNIQIDRQLIDGRPVYNSFIKKIKSDEKISLLQASVIEKSAAEKIKVSTNKLLLKKTDITEKLKKESSNFNRIEIISQENIIKMDGEKAVPYLVVALFDRTGEPFEAFFKESGELSEVKRAGSRFTDVSTFVYQEGPKLSELTEQLLKAVSAEPALSNSHVIVTSESDKKINKLQSILKFEPKDDRFDQLQVFYYLNKSFQWMKENLQIEIPRRIEAVVHIGFPEKANSAFYFQNKIRIGKGDDISYSNIPQDPSIIYHESFHALIDHTARLPFEGEGGSLNEAFADFFTCLILNRPHLAESSYLKGPYKRSLQTVYKLNDKNGGLYHDSLIVSGLLWELKEKLGSEKSQNLAVETLVQLNFGSDFKQFSLKLVEASQKILTADDQLLVAQVLTARGF